MMTLAPFAVLTGLAMADDQNPLLTKTPTAFDTRDTGGNAEGSSSIQKIEGKVQKITYVAVTETREWKDTNEKVVHARMLAFEAPEGEIAPIVRDGKIRLLVDGAKLFSLMPLERLCKEDRTYIETLAAARKRQAETTKAAR